MDDLVVTGGLDQSLPLPTEETKVVLDGVDNIITRSLEEGSPEVAFDTGRTFIKAAKLSGIALAKLAFELEKHWPEYQIDVPFSDVAMQHWGLQKVTITRYVRAWAMFANQDVPAELASSLLERPMKDLVAISTASASGYDIKPEQWQELADAPDNTTVLETLREVKGVPPRSNSMVIRMSRDGSLKAYSDNQSYFIGYLETEAAKDEPMIEKAINRIVNGAGILQE